MRSTRRPQRITTIINKGISQRAFSPSRARSSPVAVSLLAPQLTCTQGRKKQTNKMSATLTVALLTFSIPNPLGILAQNLDRQRNRRNRSHQQQCPADSAPLFVA